jgi:hypothetical protein
MKVDHRTLQERFTQVMYHEDDVPRNPGLPIPFFTAFPRNKKLNFQQVPWETPDSLSPYIPWLLKGETLKVGS